MNDTIVVQELASGRSITVALDLETVSPPDLIGSLQSSGWLSPGQPLAPIIHFNPSGKPLPPDTPMEGPGTYALRTEEGPLNALQALAAQGIVAGQKLSIEVPPLAGGFSDTVPGIISLSLLSAGLYDLIRSGVLTMAREWLNPAIHVMMQKLRGRSSRRITVNFLGDGCRVTIEAENEEDWHHAISSLLDFEDLLSFTAQQAPDVWLYYSAGKWRMTSSAGALEYVPPDASQDDPE